MDNGKSKELSTTAPNQLNLEATLQKSTVKTALKIHILTDVIILMSRPELKAKREGGEELKLLRETQGSIGTLGPIALPALEAPHAVLTGQVTIMVDHEEDVALHATVRLRALVIRTVHVQVIVDAHSHRIFALPEPAIESQSIRSLRMTDIQLL